MSHSLSFPDSKLYFYDTAGCHSHGLLRFSPTSLLHVRDNKRFDVNYAGLITCAGPMLPNLPLARYRLRFQAIDPVKLPDYAGSAWRGALGHALKRLVCVTKEPVCADCLLYRSCAYPYVFETPPHPAVGKLRKYTAAPHPFVLLPTRGGVIEAGLSLELYLTLFGHGNRYLPYLIHALAQAGQHGFGTRRGRMELRGVEQAEVDSERWRGIFMPGQRLNPHPASISTLPPCPARILLTLETPLRIKATEHHLTPQSFRFAPLFSNLLRRVSLLSAFHTDTPLETDFAALVRAAHAVEVECAALRWHDWTRYSSRQDTLLQMGGLLGHVTLRGDLAPFWPYLWLGQWCHAGKGTSLGLGKYRMDQLV